MKLYEVRTAGQRPGVPFYTYVGAWRYRRHMNRRFRLFGQRWEISRVH